MAGFARPTRSAPKSGASQLVVAIWKEICDSCIEKLHFRESDSKNTIFTRRSLVFLWTYVPRWQVSPAPRWWLSPGVSCLAKVPLGPSSWRNYSITDGGFPGSIGDLWQGRLRLTAPIGFRKRIFHNGRPWPPFQQSPSFFFKKRKGRFLWILVNK